MTQTIAPQVSELSLVATAPRTGPIIVAVAGADSRRVLRAARLLAPCVPAGVVAVSVFEPLATYAAAGEMSFEPPSHSAIERAELAASLLEQVEECAGTDHTWRTTILDGDPPHALAELARSLDSPLIVMGMGRHHPADRIAGVETCLRTIQRAPCAVLAVHADLAGTFHDVVLATDFTPESAHAGEIVVPLLSESATLHLVHVREEAAGATLLHTAAADASAVRLADQFRRLMGVLSAPHGVTVTPATLAGNAAEQIVDYADGHHADLIVAGRRRFNALKRMFVGSVTTEGPTRSKLLRIRHARTNIRRHGSAADRSHWHILQQ